MDIRWQNEITWFITQCSNQIFSTFIIRNNNNGENKIKITQIPINVELNTILRKENLNCFPLVFIFIVPFAIRLWKNTYSEYICFFPLICTRSETFFYELFAKQIVKSQKVRIKAGKTYLAMDFLKLETWRMDECQKLFVRHSTYVLVIFIFP